MIRLFVLVALATGLISHAWGQTYPGQFPSGTIYGNSTGSPTIGFPMTGLQAESVLQFLQSGSGAVQRSLDSKLKDFVSVADFGASGSAQNTTGTISATSNSLVLASALDFVNGQGIRVNHAGAAFTLASPTSCTATPHGTTGSTTYQYKIASLDAAGGIGAPTATFQTTTGNATLSMANYVTVACTAAASVPGYALYRSISGTFTLVGIVNSNAISFNDYGQGIGQLGAPDFVPNTAQATALPDWLITSITAGGGTTTLTLAVASTSGATSQGVYHDDTTSIANALAFSNNVLFGCGTYYVSSVLTVSKPATSIVGTSPGAAQFHGCSIIDKISVNVDLFQFTGGPGNYVQRLEVISPLFQTAGALFDFLSAAGGGNRLVNLSTQGGFTVAIFNSNYYDFIDNFVFNAFNGNGIQFSTGYGGLTTISNGTLYADCIYNTGFGLFIQSGNDFALSNLNVACEFGPIMIQPATSQTVQDIDADHVLADGVGPGGNYASVNRQISINGWTFDGATNSGVTLQRVRCTACWGSSMPQNGFQLSKLSGFTCSSCESYVNTQHGMNIFQSTDISIVASKFIGNSFFSAGMYNGINITSNSSKIAISSTQSGTSSAFSSVSQGVGFFSDNTTSNIGLCNNISLGNMTNAYSINGSTSTPTCGNQ